MQFSPKAHPELPAVSRFVIPYVIRAPVNGSNDESSMEMFIGMDSEYARREAFKIRRMRRTRELETVQVRLKLVPEFTERNSHIFSR